MKCTAWLYLAAFALPSLPASAGVLVTDRAHLDEGNIVALLEASGQRHVDAMRSIITAKYPGEHRARRWEVIETHARDTPLARMEYQYTENGGVRTRTYHAIAGEPLDRVALRAFDGTTPPDTPTTPDSTGYDSESAWSDDEGTGAARVTISDEDIVAGEATDDLFYSGFDQTDIRAPFRPGTRSVMKPYWHEGRYHGLDAEQKALRAIEDDILDGIVPRGGRVRGLLSSTVCHTCRRPIERLAEAYDLDIHLTEMSPTIPSPLKKELIDTGLARMKGLKLVDATSGRAMGAFDALSGARDAQVRESLSPAALERTSRGLHWQRRSFRLGVPRQPRISESSSVPETTPAEEVAEDVPPSC